MKRFTFPSIQLPDVSKLFSRKKSRSLLPALVSLVIFLALIFAGWWLSPFLDDVYALVPGYYQIEEYNSLTEEKNEINEENVILYETLTGLEEEYNQVPTTEEGYSRMMEIDNDMITVLNDLSVQLERSSEIDTELLRLRLPEVVNQYVELSQDLDEIQIEINTLSAQVSAARRDQNELRLLRSDFDNCLLAVNWNESEKTVSEAITACVQKIPPLQETVGRMELSYGADLDQMSMYFLLLKEEWEAEASYYQLISERNYTQATEFDTIFVDRKRQISELNIVDVFNEFTVETLGPMQEELVALREKAQVKETAAVRWYENNIAR